MVQALRFARMNQPYSYQGGLGGSKLKNLDRKICVYTVALKRGAYSSKSVLEKGIYLPKSSLKRGTLRYKFYPPKSPLKSYCVHTSLCFPRILIPLPTASPLKRGTRLLINSLFY